MNDKKPKVGTIAFSHTDNYGGVLQAYALQRAIIGLGYDSEVINYDPSRMPGRARHILGVIFRRLFKALQLIGSPSVLIKRLNKGILHVPSRHPHKSSGTRGDKFRDFRDKYIKSSIRRWTTLEELMCERPKYDAYITGSDQVWNPYMMRTDGEPRFDPAYFLVFAPEHLRISYAPSISVPKIPPQQWEAFSKLVSGIRHLSCREHDGAMQIKNASGRVVNHVLDPVFLLEPEDWMRIANNPPNERYLLCYFLGSSRSNRTLSKRIAERLGLKIRVISSFPDDESHLGAKSVSGVGPTEFLELIRGAQYICTDSFHGTAFAVIFEKPFSVFDREQDDDGKKSMTSRIHGLLSQLSLSGRFVSRDANAKDIDHSVDYLQARAQLRQRRAESLNYLRTALHSVICNP